MSFSWGSKLTASYCFFPDASPLTSTDSGTCLNVSQAAAAKLFLPRHRHQLLTLKPPQDANMRPATRGRPSVTLTVFRDNDSDNHHCVCEGQGGSNSERATESGLTNPGEFGYASSLFKGRVFKAEGTAPVPFSAMDSLVFAHLPPNSETTLSAPWLTLTSPWVTALWAAAPRRSVPWPGQVGLLYVHRTSR